MKTIERISIRPVGHKTRCWRFFGTVLSVLFLTSALAQSNRLETEQGLTEAIAPFDASVRKNILVASEYPNTLVQLKHAQAKTAASFEKMIAHFRQKKQEWFYTITRYPDLMHRLAYLPARQTQADINSLLPDKDPGLQEAAWRLYKSEKKNLVKLDNIRLNANGEFEQSITHFNGNTREAFHQLQAKPEILTLLTNNIELTSRLGERYKRSPGEVTNQLTMLHDKLEIQNERDAAALKKQLEEDPKAMKELRAASNAYASNSYYNNPYYSPYSYWFGYPYWYSYPMWYPGMYWYAPGFSFGVGGLYGFPSYGFSYWFYNRGYYTRYPNLSRQFTAYYRSNRTTTFAAAARVNSGFMHVAALHYNPGSFRTNVNSPYSFGRTSNLSRMNHVNMNNGFNTGAYHTQSWGGRGGIGGLGGVHMGGRH